MPLKLDAEKEGKDVAAKYKVTGFPTILFVDSNGKVVHTIVGYMPPSDFTTQMKLANLAKDLPKLEAASRANPQDSMALANLVSIYAAQKREAKMTAALDKFRAADRAKPSGMGAKTLNAVGDYYQLSGNMKGAIPYFEEAGMVATDPHDTAYSLISQAGCLLGIGDKKAAIPVLERLLNLGPAGKDYEAAAKSMLEAARKG